MFDSITQFEQQLLFKPEIVNGPVDARNKKIILAGMGGSALSPSLIQIADPSIKIQVHRNYGLPNISQKDLAQSLLVASSYSGNTEETLNFLEHALKIGLRPVVITSGGKLLARAEEERLPYIKIPNTVIQPRVAVGLSIKALAVLLGKKDTVDELERIGGILKPAELEGEGKRIAEALSGFIPLIYASAKNKAIVYNWKIKINETAKLPAFENILPELNHNELAGFAKNEKAPRVPFKLLLVKDSTDHERIAKRMKITAEVLAENGISNIETALDGKTSLERALRSLVVADWASYHLALSYSMNPDDNPVVEEFKKRIA